MSKRNRIVKKKTNKFQRFETDRHKCMNVFYSFNSIRKAGEDQEVSIVESEEDTREL